MKEKTLTVDSKYIEWIPHVAAKSSKQTIKSCYVDPIRSGLSEQLAEMISKNILPHHVNITGKKKMKMKIDTYQNDGFWFSTPEDKGKVRWRLWVEAGLLLNPPTQEKLVKAAKKATK